MCRAAQCHDILIYHRSRGRLDKAWGHDCAAFGRQHGFGLSKARSGLRHYAEPPTRDPTEPLALFRAFREQSTANVPSA